MERKAGKLKFEKLPNGSWRVFLYRNHDKSTQELKDFKNAETWAELHDQEDVIEYVKPTSKQVQIFQKGAPKPFYDSSTPANTPVYPSKEEAIIVTKKQIDDDHSDEYEMPAFTIKKELPDSFLLTKAKVPSDVKALPVNREQVDNFYLKLNRFARFENIKGDEKFYFFNPKKREDGPKGNKKLLLEEFEIKANYGKIQFSEIINRQQLHAKAVLGNNTINLIQKEFTPNWRLIVGLGGESVYETSITLHHIYGFPYIPASSIKGVLRSFIIAEVFGTEEYVNNSRSKQEGEENYPLLNAEFRALTESEDFCKIFGCPNQADRVEFSKGQPIINNDKRYKTQSYPVALRKKEKSSEGEAHQGNVIFFDALPTEEPNIQPDIMNPHYGDWYGNKKDRNGPTPPTETQSPVPVFFLTVKGTFQFLFGSKKLKINEKFWKEKTLAEWLKEALTQQGIGAKTAVGYGAGELKSLND